MRRPALALLALLIAVFLPSPPSPAFGGVPLHLWSESFGNTSLQQIQAVAVDASGNIFITGHYSGPLDLGGSTLYSNGSYDIFLAKYNASGAHLWSQTFGGAGIDEGLGLAVDSAGNVLMTGHIFNSVDLGGGILAAQGDDIFLAKYSPGGSHLWSHNYGDTQTDYGYAVAVDGSDNVLLTGQFHGTVDFGGGGLTSAGNDDIFLAKFTAAGGHLWSKSFGYGSVDRGRGVAVDASGNVFLTGGFYGPVDFGGGPLGLGSLDIVLAKFDGNGNHLWSRSFGSSGSDDEGLAVCVDASGDPVLTGQFGGTADFGGGPLTSAGGRDICLVKCDAGGTFQWSRAYGSATDDQGNAVAADASGNVFLTGQYTGAADFGSGILLDAGGQDLFLLKVDHDGLTRLAQGFGDTGDDIGYGVVVDPSGDVVLAGPFEGSVDFGGGPLTSAGIEDVFLAKFSGLPVDPVITAVTDVPNDQGGQVEITFDASAHDTPVSPYGIVEYEVYRRQDPPPAGAGGGIEPASGEAGHPVRVRAVAPLSLAPLDAGWTYLGSVPAHGQAVYSTIAPTVGDSTVALGPYDSVFFIRAATGNPYVFCDSYPDSGYSLDNLSPAVPTNLVLADGQLFWSEAPVADLDYFTVYGSDFFGFGGAAVVDYTVTSGMDVSASPYLVYYVTATDFSGNESAPAWLSSPTGVGETPGGFSLSLTSFPNPFAGRTTVLYTLPAPSLVTVTVYDARGARVAVLVDREPRDAGAHRAEWDGRSDSGGDVPSGVYFARIESDGAVVSRKVILAN